MAGSNLTILDRAIGWMFPAWGARRAEYRMSLRSYYAAGRQDHQGQWYPPQNTPPETTDAPYRSLIRARARDLERNGDVTEGVIDAFIRNIVGAGYGLEAQVESPRGIPLDFINDKIEEIWNEWGKAENCDITGYSSFNELLEMIVRRWDIDGEIYVMKVIDPDGYLPLKLQLLEPDMLAEDVFQCGKNYVFGGVEVDKFMRPVAYHFRPDPLPYLKSQEIIRYEADSVIHIYTKKRPQQTRGITDMTVSMQRNRNLEEYITSEQEAARTAAGTAGVVISQMGAGAVGIGRQNTKNGERIETIKPNSVHYLNPNEDIKFPQPGRPNPAAPLFISTILRQIAMSRGLSYETVTRDISKTNYSSHRGGQLEDRKTYKRKQKILITKFCDRVYNWFLEAAVLSGRVALPNFFNDAKARKRYSAHRWSTPGWQWVDPLKEIQAVEGQLSLGITTLSEVCGEQGKDWYEVLRERQKEIEICKELGFELPWMSAGFRPNQNEGGEQNSKTQESE